MSRSKKNILLGVSLAALIGLAVQAPSAVAAEVTLRVHHFLPASSNAQKLLIEPWAEQLEADSDGRIRVQIYPSMQLGGRPPQLIDQVRDGVADAVWTLPSYTPGRFPIAEVFELPFMTSTAYANTMALQTFAEEYLQEEFRGIHPLLFHTHAPGLFMLKDASVTRVEDLQRKRIRTPTRSITEALTLLGATPVGMPVPELPQAMSTGVIDGTTIPWEVATPLRMQEMLSSYTEIEGDRGLYTSVFLFAMNQRTYDRLPDDLKEVIDRHSGSALAERIGHAYDEAEIPGRNLAQEHGVVAHTLPAEEAARMQELTQPVIDEWVANMDRRGHDGAAMLQRAQELIEHYSSEQVAEVSP
jgi:TRAP-type transport system periplasmic protein